MKDNSKVPLNRKCFGCGGTWSRGHNTITWEEHCDKYHTDPVYKGMCDNEANILIGEALKDFNDEEVMTTTRSGFTIDQTFLALTEADVMAITQGPAPQALGLQVDKYWDQAGNPVEFIFFKDPENPYRKVHIFTEVSDCKQETLMPLRNQLRKEQATDVHKWLKDQSNASKNPKCLLKPEKDKPMLTLEALKSRADRYKADRTAPAKPDVAADDVAEASEDDGDDDVGSQGVVLGGGGGVLSCNNELFKPGPKGRGKKSAGRGRGRGKSGGKVKSRRLEAGLPTSVVEIGKESDNGKDNNEEDPDDVSDAGTSFRSPGKGKTVDGTIKELVLSSILAGETDGRHVYQAKRFLRVIENTSENKAEVLLLRSHIKDSEIALQCCPDKARANNQPCPLQLQPHSKLMCCMFVQGCVCS